MPEVQLVHEVCPVVPLVHVPTGQAVHGELVAHDVEAIYVRLAQPVQQLVPVLHQAPLEQLLLEGQPENNRAERKRRSQHKQKQRTTPRPA